MAIHGTYTQAEHTKLMNNAELIKSLRVPSTMTKAQMDVHWGSRRNITISRIDITSLSGLGWITEVDGNLIIRNSSLSEIDSFPLLTRVGGKLFIQENRSLEIVKLSELSLVSGNVCIENNSNLRELAGMTKLIKIGGDLKIRQCGYLEDIRGIKSLSNIEGDLEISHCPMLTEISGLDVLLEVKGDVIISNCPILVHTDFLSSLRTARSISITDCNNISDLSGLHYKLRIERELYLTSHEVSSISGLGFVPEIELRDGYFGSVALMNSGYNLLLVLYGDTYPVGRIFISETEFQNSETLVIIELMISALTAENYDSIPILQKINGLSLEDRTEVLEDLTLISENSSRNIKHRTSHIVGVLNGTQPLPTDEDGNDKVPPISGGISG